MLDEYIHGKKTEPFANNFVDRKTVIGLFDKLFSKLANFKYWMLSYNSRSFPTKEVLMGLLQKYSSNVVLYEMPYAYKVTGKEKKQKDVEYLFVVKNEK